MSGEDASRLPWWQLVWRVPGYLWRRRRLTYRQRLCLWLREIEGRSYREIGLATGQTVVEVRQGIFAAREVLRGKVATPPLDGVSLKRRRLALGCSQRTVAMLAYVSRTTVCEIERGTRTGQETMRAVATALTKLEERP